MEEILRFPVVISREGKWFVACCPPLDLATQGRTEREVLENMRDLIEDYLSDPDTSKPDLAEVLSAPLTLTSVSMRVPRGVLHKAPSASTT